MGESVTRRLLRVKDAIDRDLARPWRTEELAQIALVSPTHFRRTFRAAFGESPWAYLYRRRIGRAKMLLRTTDTSVTEISSLVGYASLGTFTRTFLRLTGETPTQHRARGPLPPVPSCVVREVERPRADAVTVTGPGAQVPAPAGEGASARAAAVAGEHGRSGEAPQPLRP